MKGTGTHPRRRTAKRQRKQEMYCEEKLTEIQKAICEAFEELDKQGAQGDPETIQAALAQLDKQNTGTTEQTPRLVGPADPQQGQTKELSAILQEWGAHIYECGATARDEENKPMMNQCFYLALAAGIEDPEVKAVRLKRRIEAAYLSRLPEWSKKEVRKATEQGTYSDILNLSLIHI